MSFTGRILICLLILIVGWIILAPVLANHLIVSKPLEKADVILVLSGSTAYQERTYRAATEYQRGVAGKILLTDDGGHAGWSQKEQKNPKFVELARRELIKNGVAEEDIAILEPEVTGTIYEAKALEKDIGKNGWKSVLIVTSAYHTRRSYSTFTEVINNKDLKIGIVSTTAPGKQTPSARTWWLSRRGWEMVAGEYVKSFYYWVYY